MSAFNKAFEHRKRSIETQEKKSWMINEALYTELQRISNEKYNATINELVVVAIEELVKNENIKSFPTKNNFSIKRSFTIPTELFEKLKELKEKYNESITKLVNIAIYNAIEEDRT